MPRAGDLLRQGRDEELWQMCCGYLGLGIDEFMAIQERLLEEQLARLAACPLGAKIMRGARPKSVAEFRRLVPLTTYKDYCPELIEKREDVLPARPEQWVHTSGRSGDYPCKWVPFSQTFSQELGEILFGVGILSSCRDWGDISQVPTKIKLLYAVAQRPYVSGAFADILSRQASLEYMPTIEEAERLPFDERLKLGFRQAMSRGLDCFFGLSLVLVAIGERFRDASQQIDLRPFIGQPRALWRLAKGVLKSRLARRALLPRDLWSVKGIIGSGLDSWVYKEKVKELWGRYPLDLYSCSEGGVIATQTWDYEGMTFVPNLNFLEFVPEEEVLKWEMDRSYQPQTLLLDEVEAGEDYEVVITNFHGGALVRYRIGDMIEITSRRNEQLGINLPQMAFERRTDGVLDFAVVKLTEKKIWQAIENTGVAYEDWIAYKTPGDAVLHLLIEPKEDCRTSANELAATISRQLLDMSASERTLSGSREDWRDAIDFGVEVGFLPRDTFAAYRARKQAAGADPAHLKPPHINHPAGALSELLAGTEETIIVTKAKIQDKTVPEDTEGQKSAEKAQNP